jgi:hypothetical protein
MPFVVQLLERGGYHEEHKEFHKGLKAASLEETILSILSILLLLLPQ